MRVSLRSFALLLVISFLFLGCNQAVREKPEFLEVRIHRWTALEGGETLLVRRIGSEWSAFLLGDGVRFSCLYQRPVPPKSDWNQLWSTLLSKGLLEIPEGQLGRLVVEDGDGFDIEITHEGRLRRIEIPQPRSQTFPEAKRILDISDLIWGEFDSPVFRAEYNRGEVGEYLIDNCQAIKREYSRP